MDNNITRREIENTPVHGAKGLALIAKKLGFGAPWSQLDFGNGASATNLIEFFDQNPGACEAVVTWILEEGSTVDGTPVADLEEEDEEDTEEPA